jgi:hypothetical protein
MKVTVTKNRLWVSHRATRPILIVAAILVLSAGCHPVGPSAIKRDRLHYASAVSDSWKEQLLLNIVKSRYGDAPVFLDVSSVISGYTVESRVSASAEWQPTNPEDFLSLGASRVFTDRPTISYSPMTGEKFARSLMSPVPLDALMFVIQGGVSAGFIMGLMVYSFEGYHNVGASGRGFEPADPKFQRLLELVGSLIQNRSLETEIIEQKGHAEVWLHFRSADPLKAVTKQYQAELKSLLEVPAGLDRVRVVFGSGVADPAVIGIRTRSLMQIMGVLGAGVRIQPDHLTDGSSVPVDYADISSEFTVHSGPQKPEGAFVAVPYEGLWFWIDRQDFDSKFTLSVVTILFNFLESGSNKVPAVLTIPTN